MKSGLLCMLPASILSCANCIQGKRTVVPCMGVGKLPPIANAESLTEEELEVQEDLGDQAGSSLAVSHLCSSADADSIVGCVQRPLLKHMQCFPLA